MSLLVFVLGFLLAILSHPKILRLIMTRLFNEGLVAPKIVKPEQAELIRYAGPNLSLFFLGIVLMLMGLILRQSSIR